METFIPQLKADIKRYPARAVTTNTLIDPNSIPHRYGARRSYTQDGKRHWLFDTEQGAAIFAIDYEEFIIT